MLDNATLGPFVLHEEIGQGGMARVFSAFHESDGTPVAVKLMLPGLMGSAAEAEAPDEGTMRMSFEDRGLESEFAQAFGYEVQAAAQLDHPCITTVYDHGFVSMGEQVGRELPEGAPWLAMELVSGGSLADDITPRTWPEVRQIMLDVLDGLAHAHARGMIHRDIKPGNVLCDATTGRVKLADFGLAHSIRGEREGALADNSDIIGTPAYMAPEQIETRWQDYGPWTDLYAVGVMAWTLSTGRPPYQGDITTILEHHLRGELPKFLPVHPMPAGFQGWVEGMMHPQTNGRFRRAADAAWALSQLGEGEDGEGDAPRPKVATGRLQTLVVNASGPTTTFTPAEALARHLHQTPQEALREHALVRAPVPADWRTPRAPRRHLHGAGLALFEHRATGLVGRMEERDALWQALHAVTRDLHLRCVLLDGPSGSGKSTLARWLTERGGEVGAIQQLVVSHSAAGGASEGMGPMLSRHFRIQDLPRAEAVARVAEHLRALGVDDREEAMALTELAHRSTDEENRATGLGVRFSGPRERHVLLARYLGLLARMRPIVLWMDDLVHGPDTQAFLTHLLETGLDAPVLVLATAEAELLAERDDELFEGMLRYEACERLTLEPLNREEQSALVRELLGLEPELAAQVESRSAGNPLFAVQLVGDWIQRGLLVTGEEGFRLADGADARMPDDLAQVWQQRVERLFSDRAQSEVDAIELAAMLGQDIHPEEWEDVCAAGGLSIPTGLLSELMRRRLVTSQGEYLGWSFAHAMIHEALMARAKAAGRLTRWASLCADVLSDTPRTIVRRARYLLQADRTEEAIAPLHRAVGREMQVGELGRARELHTLRIQALEKLDVPHDDPRRIQTQILENTLRRNFGQIEFARQAGETTLRRARQSGDPTIISEALHAHAGAAAHQGELELAQQCMEEAMDIARQLRLESYPVLCIAVCFIHIRQGALDRCMERAREAIFSGEALGEPGYVAKGYGLLARGARQAGDSHSAEFFLEEARLRCEREGDRNGLASVWNTLGELKREAGNLAGAEEAYTEAMQRYDACGSAAGCYSRLNLGMTLAAAGKAQEANERLLEVREEATGTGHRAILAALHVVRLPALVSLEEWRTVEMELAEAERTIPEMKLVDVDIANYARMAAQRCDAAQRSDLARRCWTIAHDQWTAMDRTDEAAEAAAHL